MTRYAVKFLYLGFLLFPTILWSLNLTFESKPVVSIQFKGQENIPESELKKLISFKTGGFLQKPSLFNQRVLDWDRNEIQRYFISEGYLHCHVTDSLSLNENNEVNIFIFIDEGPRFYVNSVTLEGNTLISDEKIQSLLSAEPGKPFRPFDYQRGLQSMRDEYAKIGYPFITIDERIQESSNHIDITLILDEDGLYTVDNIDIKGNNTVLEKTIRKELVVKPGDVYNLKNIQKSRLHIFELGTFNSVNIVPVAPKPDSLTVGLQVQVLESKPRRWDANIGIKQGRIADLNQTYLFTEVEWLHKNLFHRAHRLQAKGNFGIVWDQETFFKKSSPSYGMDVSYTRPRIFSLRLPTTFKVYYNKNVYSPFSQDIDENDELITTGFEVSSLWKMERKLNTIASFTLRRVESILSEEDQEIQRRFNWRIHYDNRDNFLFPKKGWNMWADFQWVKGVSGSPTNYYQWDVSVSRYQALFEKGVLAARVETGFIDNRTDKPPLIVMYRLGTETTVRGWSQSIGREFKTPDGLIIYADYAKILANIELRIDLFRNFGLEFFVDAGRLNESFTGLWDPEKFYVSAGPGLMYSTIIGPIRLEFPFVVQDPSDGFHRWEQPEKHFLIALLFAF